ncbi:alpha/beta fold hydrolase [Pleurocapsa sp. PCC 7319]|uniref:alpha/beta fold hydrolase n=1 Tax=Pleurocapsa sp. PCC 7319 TaxID=118161 RepID=UPI0003469B05|nr:alpha/beta hydrolase [Pleurocapsa sp. PCC 7319]
MTAINPEISEHISKQGEHETYYLAAGPKDGPLLIFVHGWPELAISWQKQLLALSSLGFFCVAPDKRGYGNSTIYSRNEDYALEHVVGDLMELMKDLGRDKAVWIGHDWGGPVVWSLAMHHPEACVGVAGMCAAYGGMERGLDSLIPLVNRDIYPEEEFPAGQWEYQRFYEESFEQATAAFDALIEKSVRAIFRKSDPDNLGKPASTAYVRKNGGWFEGKGEAPDLALDTDVMEEAEYEYYVEKFKKNGFFGPDSYYMNHERNRVYAEKVREQWRLKMPILFLHARYDYVCDTLISRIAEPMRLECDNVSEQVLDTSHWMGQERPQEVNAALAAWLARSLPHYWPKPARTY